MALEQLQLDQISKMILDQIDPVASRDLVVRPSQLIDNPKAVYEELLINSYSPNKFAGRTEYEGRVLLNLEINDTSFLNYLKSFLPHIILSGDSTPRNPRLMFCKIISQDKHAALGEPLIALAKGGPFEYIKRVLRFPAFETAVQSVVGDADLELLAQAGIGSIVNISTVDGSIGKVTKVLALQDMSRMIFDNAASGGGSAAAHSAGDTFTASDEIVPLSRQTTTEEFADLPPGSIIEGFDEDSVTLVAEAEIKAWTGLKETSEEAYPLLEKYWNNDPNNLEWTPSGTPWSAVFVSYIMNNSVGSFPNSASHAVYSRAVSEGNSGYSFIKISDLPKGAKVQANLGDILLYERDSQGASHGDVVYLTPNVKKARLVGGNLSDTVSTMELDLEGDAGYYASFGKYKFIIKHNAYVQYPQSENNS